MAELNAERWAEVERLFQCASDLPPEKRVGFLQRECSDPDLQREVASLLEHSGLGLSAAKASIASAAAEMVRDTDPDERLIGLRLGPYKVEAIAGHGGMGAVYRAARDDDEFHQQVAIKLVRAMAESPSTLRRFRQERQILARLSHPNIARLLDGGSTAEGIPYLVMEFIEGEPLTAWCDRQSFGVEERLRLFVRVCEGVEFAHREMVVHRDLKPANIMVTQDGTPKLLDFGIAKLLDPAADTAGATLTGLQVMTPDYASPEQVRGEPVSTSADVYALGLILYELLTGMKAQQTSGNTPGEIARVVCQMEPAAPALVKPQLAGDLDNIIRMAIRKEPERRYATAGELARDIQRYLEGRTVSAQADTLKYRSVKFFRRNRLAVGAVAVVASLAAGLIFSLASQRRALPRVLQVAQLTQSGAIETADGVATDGARVYFTERSRGQRLLVQVSVQGGTAQPLPLTSPLMQPDILDISPDHSSLLVASALGAALFGDERPLWVVPTAGGTPRRLGDLAAQAGAWSRDGSQIVFGRGDAVFLANRDGTAVRKLADLPGIAGDIRWSPAPGPNVLRASVTSEDGKSRTLWELAADGTGLHRLLTNWKSGPAIGDGEDSGRWLSGGRYYLFRARRDRVASIWSLHEGHSFFQPPDRTPVQIYSSALHFTSLAAAPDGKRVFIAAGQELRELVRYDARLGRLLPFLPGISGRWVDFSKDGLWVAYTTANDGLLWRCRPDGSERSQLTRSSLNAVQPRWSPDGTRIAFGAAGASHQVDVYVIPSAGGVPEAVASHGSEPNWSPDGKSLLFLRAVPGLPGPLGLYLLDLATRTTKFVPGMGGTVRPAWSPDGRFIAASQGGQRILLFDFKTGQWSQLVKGSSPGVPFWSRDGKYVYYQETLGPGQPIFRVAIGSREIERLMTSEQIPQSNLTGYALTGLAPDDAPIANVIRSNSDIYALDVDLP
jgi:Tol biopolymer transport system component